MPNSKHDQISERLAKKEKVEYNKGKGPDVIGQNRVIEVATHESDLYSSIKQVNRYKKPKYLATSTDLVQKALKVTENSGIGVMGPSGKIFKRARKK